jgi:hypothetical protein
MSAWRLRVAEEFGLGSVTLPRTVWRRDDSAWRLKERTIVAIILIWLSILAGVVTLALVVSSLRKVAAGTQGASRTAVATALFSLLTGALTIASLVASLQQLGLR